MFKETLSVKRRSGFVMVAVLSVRVWMVGGPMLLIAVGFARLSFLVLCEMIIIIT